MHLNLVAHPTKVSKGREETDPNTKKSIYLDSVPSAYDIFGGSEFYNQADMIMVVYRNMLNNLTEVYIKKTRKKQFGRIGVEYFTMNTLNGRYTPVFTDDRGELVKGTENLKVENFIKNSQEDLDDVPF